jgi:hypothetical protein
VASAQNRKEGAGDARAGWLAALYAATPADRAAAVKLVHAEQKVMDGMLHRQPSPWPLQITLPLNS